MGVQIRSRYRVKGSHCNGRLMDYRECQLQPCTCTITKAFYETATGHVVPKDGIQQFPTLSCVFLYLPILGIIGYVRGTHETVMIDDSMDTKTIVYTNECTQIICSNSGLEIQPSKHCRRNIVFPTYLRI